VLLKEMRERRITWRWSGTNMRDRRLVTLEDSSRDRRDIRDEQEKEFGRSMRCATAISRGKDDIGNLNEKLNLLFPRRVRDSRGSSRAFRRFRQRRSVRYENLMFTVLRSGKTALPIRILKYADEQRKEG